MISNKKNPFTEHFAEELFLGMPPFDVFKEDAESPSLPNGYFINYKGDYTDIRNTLMQSQSTNYNRDYSSRNWEQKELQKLKNRYDDLNSVKLNESETPEKQLEFVNGKNFVSMMLKLISKVHYLTLKLS